ncbi:PQQ-binding-like beta-propeller repeat protein [Neorhodopirellula pilleata]|nr:PQQ-binding-like beta-propeller repeat protein [Neorhodopirellula pilleata]
MPPMNRYQSSRPNSIHSRGIRRLNAIGCWSLLLTVITTTSVATSALAENWLQWRGADRANRSGETGLFQTWGDDGPPLEWMAEGLGGGYASVSVIGRGVFTTGNVDGKQSVVAINSDTGKVVWKQPITGNEPDHGYGGSRCTPTIDGDRLYAVSSDGRVVCLNIRDGSPKWSRDFKDWNGKMMSGWGFSESPLVDGDAVICTPGGDRGVVVALNKMTGEELWAAVLNGTAVDQGGPDLKQGAGYASPVISNGGGVKQYIQLVGRGLIGIRATDGEVLWRYARVGNTTANIPTAIVDGDYVFTSTGYNTGSALLKLTSTQGGVSAEEVYWLEGRELQNKHGGMTLVDGYIYCGHGNGDGKPICIEMKTGEAAWGPVRAEGSGETSLIYADGHILYRRQDGTLILTEATPKEFKVVSVFKPAFQERESWAHPVIANGKLYLREQDKLMCYQLK